MPTSLGRAVVAAVTRANESRRTGRMMAWDAKNEKMVPADTIELPRTPEKG